MSIPVIVPCPAGTWTKIAISVVTGFVHRKNHIPVYLQTYRDTGETAPTLKSEGVGLFLESNTESITSPTPIDVYIWCEKEAGSIRLDL